MTFACGTFPTLLYFIIFSLCFVGKVHFRFRFLPFRSFVEPQASAYCCDRGALVWAVRVFILAIPGLYFEQILFLFVRMSCKRQETFVFFFQHILLVWVECHGSIPRSSTKEKKDCRVSSTFERIHAYIARNELERQLIRGPLSLRISV